MILNQLEDIQVIGKAGKMIRLIRVMRILRIFKLVRHFAGLQSLLFTLRQAYRELGLLMLLVFVAILTFSSLVYFAEKEGYDDGSLTVNNWTFVESFWWGLMTITTVGYDLDPKTFLGKLIGGFCALSGTFILTLPIPIGNQLDQLTFTKTETLTLSYSCQQLCWVLQESAMAK